MSQPVVMPMAERTERKYEVLRLREIGISPEAIAVRCGLTKKRVLNIISENNRARGSRSPYISHHMWDCDEDTRRQEIVKRASQGARATLSGQLPA